jgi:SAM-dependent methyltransferase
LCRDFRAVDYDTSQYQKWSPEVGFIDLCNLDETLEGTFDLIIHNHVLEHVPCSVSRTIQQLRGRLNPGGVMLFSVPIRANAETIEDLNTDLTHEERKARFGQWDHMRLFGENDVLKVLIGPEKNPVSVVDTFAHLSVIELRTAFVPESVAGVTGSSIFRVKA